MSTTFKKWWYLGKPLQALQPNTKFFRYWYLGKPFNVFYPYSNPPCITVVETLHLTLGLQLPRIDIVVTPAVLHLTMAQYTPAMPNIFVAISVQHLTFASHAPTILVPTSVIAATGFQHLTLTKYDPIAQAPSVTITVSETLHLTLAKYSPSIFVANVLVTPSTLHLTLAKYSPVYVSVIASPATLHLTFSLFSPIGVSIVVPISTTLHLTLAQHSPVYVNIIASPSLLHLTLAQRSPTIAVQVFVVAPCTIQSLNFSLPSVTVLMGARLYETLDLVVSSIVPSINTSSIVSISSVHHSILNQSSVSIRVTANVTVIVPAPNGIETFFNFGTCIGYVVGDLVMPIQSGGMGAIFVVTRSGGTRSGSIDIELVSHGSGYSIANNLNTYTTGHGTGCLLNILSTDTFPFLLFESFDPQVSLGIRIFETLSLSFSQTLPDIFTSSIIAMNLLDLVLNPLSVLVHTSSLVEVGLLSLSITSFDVGVKTGINVGEVLPLTFSSYDLAVACGTSFEVNLQHLIFDGYTPNVITWPMPGIYDIDPLHKERQWGSSYHLGYGEYASRLCNSLINFPLQYGDADRQFTASFWVRFKALSGYRGICSKGVNYKCFSFYAVNGVPQLDWASSNQITSIKYPMTFVANRWYHVGLSFDGLNRDTCLYVWDDYDKKVVCSRATFAKSRSVPIFKISSVKPSGAEKLNYNCWLYLNEPLNVSERGMIFLTAIDKRSSAADQAWMTNFNNRVVQVLCAKSLTCYAISGSIPNENYPGGGQAGHYRGGYADIPVYAIDTPVISIHDTTEEFSIGRAIQQSLGSIWLDGYIDEFVVFDKLKSPYELDQIRKGNYNSQCNGQAVGDLGISTAYTSQGKVTIGDFGVSAGYDPFGKVTVAECGYTIGYTVAIPPPPPEHPVIMGFPSPGSNVGSYTFCNLTYKFKSEVSSFDWNSDSEARASQFTYPTRELEAMIGVADESAFLRLKETLSAGATFFSVPIWALRTSLVSNAQAGLTEFISMDTSNLYVNEKAVLVRANDADIYDLCDITSVSGITVDVNLPLNYHYHKFTMPTTSARYDERSAYVVPCITGIVNAEETELKGDLPSFFLKVKVDGGVWSNAPQPGVTAFLSPPAEAGYTVPKMDRVVLGTENGMQTIMSQLSTSKLSFQAEWYFKDSTWKDFRDLFLAVKGKYRDFEIPTWCFELRTTASCNVGDTTIKLTSGFSQIWDRFKSLYVVPQIGNPFIIQLTGGHAIGSGIPSSGIYSHYFNFVDDHISGGGFLQGPMIPGSLSFYYSTPGSPYHEMIDDGNGLLVGPGVEYGYIIYSTPASFIFSVAGITNVLDLTASYQVVNDTEYFDCEPLEGSLVQGDRICFYPQVRFMEDELVFEFLYYNMCKVKTSFVEVLA